MSGRPSLVGNPHQTRARFRFGPWLVAPALNTIENADETRQMEPRTMDVLVALCRADGAIVSTEELLEQCWGSTIHGDSPVHKNIAQLRRLLGDNANAPVFIETIRKRGYRTVAAVDLTVDDIQPPHWENGSPFRGLLPFDESHAGVFYGRDEATCNLAQAAQTQIDNGLALLLLLGPSGSGKTSLVQAGLFPAMSRAQAGSGPALLATTAFDVADQGEQTLFTALAGAMLDLHWDETYGFPDESAIALGQRLERDCTSVINQLQAALAPHGASIRFALFIDRFEALFNANRVTEAERGAFLAALEQLARSGTCLIVIACRNDFYPNIATLPLLIEVKPYGGHVDLAPPSFSDIAQMIRKPAAAAQLVFGVDPVTHASLDDILCESATASPDALPLLQYCLHELYRQRTPDGELSFDAFHELGGLEGAIGRRAEQVVVGLSDDHRAELPHIMSLVTVLAIDEELVTSQRAPWSALRSEQARDTVTALIEARLFVSDLASGTRVFGIAHEAILRRWPRMSEWIGAHRDALRARGRLAQQVARWSADGRRADLLIPRGKLLDEAKELRDAGLWSLEPGECELIRLSNRRARQFEWARLSALGLIIVLAVLNSALALSALAAKRTAEARRTKVEGLVDYMLGDFADKLRPLGKLELLEGVSGKSLEYLRSSQQDELSPAALTLRAKALQVIGEVSREQGNAAQTIAALTEANAILRRQHEADPKNTQVLKNLGDNNYYIGQMHKDHNDMPAAAAAWQQYRLLTERLHSLEPDKVEWWIEQSYAHNNLGSLALALGKPESAEPEFAASLALKQRALQRAPGDKMLIAALADTYSWQALARQSMGELGAAEQLYEQEMELVQQVRQRFPSEPMWINRYARALQHRAVLALALGKDDRALDDLAAAAALFVDLAQNDKKNRAWQVELANAEQEYLMVKLRTEPAQLILPQLQRIHANLVAESAMNPKNVRWISNETVARSRIATALLEMGDLERAKGEIETVITQFRRLHGRTPADLQIRLSLAESLLLYAKIQKKRKDDANSIIACKEAYAVIQPSTTSTRDFLILDPWSRSTLCLQQSVIDNVPWQRLAQIGYRDSLYRKLIPK
ncbi:nSTAND1 domain-containing NTPase [Massilia scottii]|uniref:nSTAND1 domain-containing NTPase n=1 Tax=Massilia scottii TaxID=3057166 RepID=UPI0027964D60|nr:winged helix-turn-helix domain-containing protein [Massilia sp. CCM 9029]MDQ1831617.1 winged helix-turn-helix domain-containing protein [Massilia sp. CCM 9029]